MKQAVLGAVIGSNRLRRTFDTLGWSTWGWTAIIGSDVANVLEVIATFGQNVVVLVDLVGGGQAIYHSPDNGDSWSKVLVADEIYDITSVGYNWTLASTSDGWYSSTSSGSTWTLIATAGPTVPVGKSMVWVYPNKLYTHTGDAIWISINRGASGSWRLVCDLTQIDGYIAGNKFHSIDGYQKRVIATNGYSLVHTINEGGTFSALDLSTVIRDWAYSGDNQPIWRQVAFWDTLDSLDPTKSQWLISAIFSKSHTIRTYINRGTGIFAPVVDMGLSDRHRLNITHTRRMGQDLTDTTLMISGDRLINGELRHAMTVSSDGIEFTDVLAGTLETGNTLSSTPTLDKAHADFAKMMRQ